MSEVTPLMRAQAEATAFAVEHGYAVALPSVNDRLADGLRRCLEAEASLEEIIASIPEAENPNDPVEVDALQWKRDMVRHQVLRAARAARERKAHLLTLRGDEDWEEERIRCGMRPRHKDGESEEDGKMHVLTLEHIKHWFRYWAWAYDPRADYMPLQPFVPFGLYDDDEATFQWEYIQWLHNTTFVRRKAGTVEKARDMGATLGWLLWATCCWLGADFYSALLSSANADLVDSSKDPDTLFEKVRFALRMQPPQLLPAGFDLVKGMPYMNISNPENGSTLSGQAPTENAGRQKRRICLLKDEFAAWPYGGFPQETALSAVSYSPFDVSSVQGEYNQFHTNATKANCNKFIMDWRDHPWKDIRWYNALPFGFVGPAMSPEAIAQEVDRDYQASQPGKVFKDWGLAIPRSVIEWPELLAYFTKMGYGDRFRHVDGTLKIPDDCNWARMQDKGETEGHPRMTLYCFRPGEGWPLSDSVFFFIEHMAPTAADLGTVVTELTQEQRNFHLEERQPQMSLLSHEAKKDRNIYLKEFGWNWQSWDTDYDSGIGNIRLWIKPIEMHKQNPIRPALMGRTRMYLVCQKGQATLAFNEKDKKHFVTPAKNAGGFQRLRAEFPVYHYPPEEAGKPVAQQRPARIFDDALVCVRAVAVKWGPSAKPESEKEKRAKRYDEDVRPGRVAQLPVDDPERDAIILSQQIWDQEFDEEERGGHGALGGFAPIKVPRRTPNRR